MIVENSMNQSLADTYVAFDIETTGSSPVNNQIIEICAVKVVGGKITDRFSTFVHPDVSMPHEVEVLTGINNNMVSRAPKVEEALPQFLAFCKGAVMVFHNAGFGMGFIKENCKRQKLPCTYTIIDTVTLARALLPALKWYKMETVAKALHVSLIPPFRLLNEATCTAEIFIKFIQMLKKRGVDRLDKVNQLAFPR